MHEHDTKTSLVFLLADGEASWLLLPSSVYLLPGGTRQPEKKTFLFRISGQHLQESFKKGIFVFRAV